MKLSNKKCFYGTLYNQTICANTLTQLKRLASRIANNYFSAIDTMRVTVEEHGANTSIFNLSRLNRKMPNNYIVYGQWE